MTNNDSSKYIPKKINEYDVAVIIVVLFLFFLRRVISDPTDSFFSRDDDIYVANILSPTIIGTQLSIPFGILFSLFFLKEKVSIKKWVLIIISFIGIVVIGFDPNLTNERSALILAIIMSFFYGGSQVFSRYLKELDVTFTNAFMALMGFVLLFVFSIMFETYLIS